MPDITLFINNHLWLSLTTIALLVLLTLIEFLKAKRNTVVLAPSLVIQKMNHENAIVIDIRDAAAYHSSHIINAVSLSAKELLASPKKLDKYKQKPLIIVCQSGVESHKIANALIKQNRAAYSLAGGMRAWLNANMPLIKESLNDKT